LLRWGAARGQLGAPLRGTNGATIIAELVEAEAGKGADALDRRPQLAASLASAKAAKCCVLVSKLDRLSRGVAFVAGLMAQRVDQLPEARVPQHGVAGLHSTTSRLAPPA
jgi:DNA invertase Pin-like site-specific DNA recombinase